MAAFLIVAVGLGILSLLRVANDRGTQALIRAQASQVEVIARSFDASYAAQLTTMSGAGGTAWELRPGSVSDQAIMDTFAGFAEDQGGFFLVNSRGVITAGVGLPKGSVGAGLGPDWPKIKAALAQRPVLIRPVSDDALTSDQPSFTYVMAIRGPGPDGLRGALVYESPVTGQSQIQAEIAGLDGPAATDEWHLVDGNGTVVGASTGVGLGKPLADARLLGLPNGLSTVGSSLAVGADIPTLGWRLLFTQDRAELTGPLSAPLQDAGLALTVLVLLIGLALSVIAVRRRSLRKLRAVDSMKSVFLATASHELRTPVAIISGFAEMLHRNAESATQQEVREFAHTILTNAQELDALTEELLDLNYLEHGGATHSQMVVDLATAVGDALQSHPQRHANHALRLTLPDEPTPVFGSTQALQRILVNLVGNAAKYSPEHSRISVIVRQEDDELRLIVDDEGPGVPPELRDKIFTRFFRGTGDAVTRTRGTGVGLSIVSEYAAGMSAKVSVESGPSGGARFTVRFPVADGPPARSGPIAREM